MNETVYILTNEAMPGYVKIGKTKDIHQRLADLYKTSVPLPFQCFYACEVADSNKVEKALHDAFDDNRVTSKREFFEIAPERVYAVLKLMELKDVTPRKDYVESEEDQQVLNETRERRSQFSFKLVDIDPGETLVFSRDENITCTVVDSHKVMYKGNESSLSAAAQDAIGSDRPIQGPRYWMYKGESLVERRERMEEE